MLYVLYGTDSKKVRTKLRDLTESLLKKRPDAAVLTIKPDTWSESVFNEYVSGINLFAPKNIIVLDSLFAHKESQDFLEENIGVLAQSDHICVVVEQKITKEYLKKLEKKAEKVQEFSNSESGAIKKEQPQTFALADALAVRNKKRAWSVFQHLISDGVVAEEIHGVVWWQFKSLYLAHMYTNAKDAGLNPYVYQKAKSALVQWSGDELSKTLKRLVMMYHKAHRGECDFMSELEMLCLE